MAIIWLIKGGPALPRIKGGLKNETVDELIANAQTKSTEVK